MNTQEELAEADGMQLLTSKQVAKLLALSQYTVNELIRDGKLGYVPINDRDRRIRLDQVHKFIAERTVDRTTDP